MVTFHMINLLHDCLILHSVVIVDCAGLLIAISSIETSDSFA